MPQPRPSASVILVRDGGVTLEAFMVRRHAQSPVLPSAYVFPGGTVREDDITLAGELPAETRDRLARTLSDRSDTPVDAMEASALYVCAIRELFEEAGVLLARDPLERFVSVSESETHLQELLESTRLALQARQVSIGTVLDERGLRPAFDLLTPFSHWITPKVLAARFDTRFFVAALPDGQSALHDAIETSEGLWLSPTEALDAQYHTVYATAQHLRRISAFTSVDNLLAFAQRKPIRMVSPDVVESNEGLLAHIPDDLTDAW